MGSQVVREHRAGDELIHNPVVDLDRQAGWLEPTCRPATHTKPGPRINRKPTVVRDARSSRPATGTSLDV